MTDHHNALPAGYRLGEYEIQTVLGSGGFGITYKARDCNLGKSVAIKEYLPADFAVRDGRTTVKPKSNANKDDYDWGLTRFLDEARTLARFDHPHINKVLRYFQDNGTAYLVLEYIEGDMLSDLLRDKGHFNESGIRRMLDELLDGLDAVHKADYIHRDIKPANIMFRRDGSAVLLDFGAARQVRGKTVTKVLTAGYAPVEQHLNNPVGARSDIYSLGICAYRCLTGGDESVLVDAPNRALLIQQGQADKDMPPAVVVGKGRYSDSLLNAIDWAMQVEETERPQSVAELRAVLADGAAKHVNAPAAIDLRAALAKSVRLAVEWNKNRIAENARIAVAARVDEEKRIAQEKHKNELAKEQAKFRQLVGRDAKADYVDAEDVTDLHIAAAQGWINMVQWLVEGGADIHARIKADDENMSEALRKHTGIIGLKRYGLQPLHFAAINEKCATVQALLANGAQVNAKDNDGGTALHWAATFKANEVVDVLLENGADVHAQTTIGYTPLHIAARSNATKSAVFLMQKGAQVDAKSSHGRTPLHLAAEWNAGEAAKMLLIGSASMEAKTDLGFTPLHIAAWKDSADVAKLLLANDACINDKNNEGATPLHIAADNNASDVAKALLASGANVHAQAKEDMTPLQTAAMADNSVDVAELLLTDGADVNAKSATGNTSLHWAASCNRHKVAKLLLENGADVHAKNNASTTPLHWAAGQNSVAVAKLLLTNGANVHVKGIQDLTPLHTASMEENSVDVARLLLANGADFHAKAALGITPLSLTALKDNDGVAKLLLESGANATTIDDGGWTPLDYAIDKNAAKVAAIIRQHGGQCNKKS